MHGEEGEEEGEAVLVTEEASVISVMAGGQLARDIDVWECFFILSN
jgi:hypothetical protein